MSLVVVEKILRKAGRSLDPEMQSEAPPSELELDEPGLASCYAAAAGGISVTGERASGLARAAAGVVERTGRAVLKRGRK